MPCSFLFQRSEATSLETKRSEERASGLSVPIQAHELVERGGDHHHPARRHAL